jgi:hypothetical protein
MGLAYHGYDVCQKRGCLPDTWYLVVRCLHVSAPGKILWLCLGQEVVEDCGFRNVELVDKLLEFES